MSSRIVALDVTGEAGVVAGGRVAMSVGLIVLLDHANEAERLRRVGAAVRQVLERASGLTEVDGRRQLVFADRPVTVWRTTAAGRPATLLLSRWEDSPGDLEVEVMERRELGSGWIQ